MNPNLFTTFRLRNIIIIQPFVKKKKKLDNKLGTVNVSKKNFTDNKLKMT